MTNSPNKSSHDSTNTKKLELLPIEVNYVHQPLFTHNRKTAYKQHYDVNIRNTLREPLNKWVVRTFIIILFAVSYHFGESAVDSVIDTVQHQSTHYVSETLCIREHIANGVERIDIKTVHGKCFIETNGYYK